MRVYKIVLVALLVSVNVGHSQVLELIKGNIESKKKKIAVLNFGTFHMGETSDANKTEFDEHDKKNQKEVHKIAQLLARFKPTVIIVETPPSYNKKLQSLFEEYKVNPNIKFKNPNEVELLAYEVGKLAKTKRIYGIDHKMGYNYKIGEEIKNETDPVSYNSYYQNPIPYHTSLQVDESNLTLLEKLSLINHNLYLDFLITMNADMLSYVGSKEGFEGADEAAKYYKRNLRMFTNLNRIKLTENDRVFILMGASHTAFFRDFISRSPKYKMVSTIDYLK